MVRLPLLLALVAAAPASPDVLTLGAQDVAAASHRDAGDLMKAIPANARSFVTTRQEARALAALAVAYSSGAGGRLGQHKTGVAEYVIAYPLWMIANSPAGSSQHLSGPTAQDYQIEAAGLGRARAARAVKLAEQAGSCAGPMVDLLNRMRAQDRSSGVADGASAAGFARRVITDLGRTVYPPDRSCS